MPLISQSTFRAVAISFIQYYRDLGQKEKYLNVISRHLRNQVYPFIGSKPIGSITEDDLWDLHNHLLQNSKSPSSRNVMMIYVKMIMGYAQVNNIIETNPAAGFPLEPVRSCPSRVFSLEECEALLRSFECTMFTNLFRFAYYSGLRFPECLAIKVHEFDPTTNMVTISEVMDVSVCNQTTTEPAPSPRQVHLNDLAAQCLLDELELRQFKTLSPDVGDYIFSSDNGKLMTYRSCRQSRETIQRESGIDDFSFKDLRDNFLLRCVQEGVDEITLAQYFGIKSKLFFLVIRGNWEYSPYPPIPYSWR